MARSIHETRRSRLEEWCNRRRSEKLARIARDLRMKRLIKRQVKKERRQTNPPDPVPVEFIPLRTHDESDVVHFPASPTDIRAIMRQLPPGVLDGLHSVSLCLGREAQEELLDDPYWLEIDFYSDDDRDPYTGRLGSPVIPTLAYSGPLLGEYMPETTKIVLYAYVYSPDIPDREMWELYLRLKMLVTFVHEVAHHWDFSARMARGRWFDDESDKCEQYAKRVTFAWVRNYVVPYLEQTYPHDVRALRQWLVQHGGAAIPLELTVCRDPALQPRFHSAPGAFYELMEHAFEAGDELDDDEGLGSVSIRQLFAEYLHRAGHHHESRVIVENLLNEPLEEFEACNALTLQAKTYLLEKDLDQAKRIAKRIFELYPETDQGKAYIVLAKVYCRLGEWQFAGAVAKKGLKVAVKSDQEFGWFSDFHELCILRLLALLKLERAAWIENEFCCDVEKASPNDVRVRLIVRVAQMLASLEQGQYGMAHRLASQSRWPQVKLEPWWPISVATHVLTARRLGRAVEFGDEQRAAIDRLQRDSHGNRYEELFQHAWQLLK